MLSYNTWLIDGITCWAMLWWVFCCCFGFLKHGKRKAREQMSVAGNYHCSQWISHQVSQIFVLTLFSISYIFIISTFSFKINHSNALPLFSESQ